MSGSAIALVATYAARPESGSDDEGALRSEAKKLAARKILRFLDRASLPTFVAATTVYRASPPCDPADVAIYTVSGWDGAMPDQPFEADGSPESDERLGRYILEDANPTGWLRMLANNALCQVSIAEGFRGPNTHLVGDAEALREALVLAGSDLSRGVAELALVVAFDPPAEQLGYPSGRAATVATAIALARREAADDARDDLADLCRCAERAAAVGEGALAALDRALETVLPAGAGR
jgi:3-oxoacyl-(acyl-carrier-protein) synthase